MPSPAVQVINVTKEFGTNVAAKNINLTIEQGEFFSFLGPSGCGKTTLLRMIAGFETPTSGQILISGKDVANVPPHKRQVNMVFQNYALFPHLTIEKNIAFGLESTNTLRKDEIAKKVAEALELVRLSHLSKRFPSQLSGGQQQRIALARAVVNSPEVLLLDEPLSALDPQIREEMQVELARLQKRLNMTFIMVTHDQNEALALSDRVAVFCQGHLEQAAKPLDIYERPQTIFVAKFIGQTNLLSGKVQQIDNDSKSSMVQIDSTDANLVVAPGSYDCSVGDDVIVWVKPHSIKIIGLEGMNVDESKNVVTGVISNCSYQGTTTDYHIDIADNVSLRVSCQNTTSGDFTKQRTWQTGDRVLLRLPIDSCSLLPAVTAKV